MKNGRELARILGCDPIALSRWEMGKSPIGTQSDKLLRLAAVFAKKVEYSLGDFEAAAGEDGAAAPLRFTLTHARGVWKVAGEKKRSAA